MNETYEFFLGGDDAEMREIKKVAVAAGCIVYDNNLSWGAKVSDYKEHLPQLMCGDPAVCGDPGLDTAAKVEAYKAANKYRYVTVELEEDIKLGKKVLAVDHHGKRSGEPPAIIQVCNLLGVTPTREQCLIGAMDAGYAFGLEAIGATNSEIGNFLGATAATVSEMLLQEENQPPEVVKEAERAISEAEIVGGCVIVRCKHNKTAPITARLYGTQSSRQNILILSRWEEDGCEKTEANYYGDGERVRAISEALPGGWTGGAGLMPPTDDAVEFWTQFGGTVPDTAFWGIEGRHQGEILRIILAVA